MIRFASMSILSIALCNLQAVTPAIRVAERTPLQRDITVTFALAPQEVLYADFLDFSTNHRALALSPWQSDHASVNFFDQTFQKNMRGFKNTVTLSFQAHTTGAPVENEAAYMTYLTNTDRKVQQVVIPLAFETSKQEQPPISQESTAPNDVVSSKTVTKKAPIERSISERITEAVRNFKDSLFRLVRREHAWWLRLLLIFLLGILVSLTPCIYPMIPITVGVLQANAGSSVAYNFLLALTYTLGVSVTFSIFGFIAATTGQLFSQLLVNPIFVLCLVALFVYLGLSLFDFYELYIPRFMREQQATATPRGSLLSTFIFGVASGTISSPCLSPGLALVLSIVASMGNKLFGLLLLFAFGVGSSMPLLLIGTFSGSLKLLPHAGMWMVEVKKLFGFMLFAMCFYYLSNIVPYSVLFLLIALFCLASGIYYFSTVHMQDSVILKYFKNIMGTAFIVAAVLAGYASLRGFYHKEITDQFFSFNYQEAYQQAQEQHKKLFVDVGASYCSICTLIDRTLLKDPLVRNALQNFVQVKVDASDVNKEPYKSLRTKYSILGAPTFMLIDPVTGQLINKWGAEINAMSPQEFADALGQFK